MILKFPPKISTLFSKVYIAKARLCIISVSQSILWFIGQKLVVSEYVIDIDITIGGRNADVGKETE